MISLNKKVVNKLIIACIVYIQPTYSCNPLLKSAYLFRLIAAGCSMVYNDYKYSTARYHALKIAYNREQLLTYIAQNPKAKTPDPQWWVSQIKEIEHYRMIAEAHKNKALISQLISHLLSSFYKSAS